MIIAKLSSVLRIALGLIALGLAYALFQWASDVYSKVTAFNSLEEKTAQIDQIIDSKMEAVYVKTQAAVIEQVRLDNQSVDERLRPLLEDFAQVYEDAKELAKQPVYVPVPGPTQTTIVQQRIPAAPGADRLSRTSLAAVGLMWKGFCNEYPSSDECRVREGGSGGSVPPVSTTSN